MSGPRGLVDVADVIAVRRLGELGAHALGDQRPVIPPLPAEVVDKREPVDSPVQRRSLVDEQCELVLNVVHPVAQPRHVEAGPLVDSLDVRRHRLGVKEEGPVLCNIGDAMSELDNHQGRPQRPGMASCGSMRI